MDLFDWFATFDCPFKCCAIFSHLEKIKNKRIVLFLNCLQTCDFMLNVLDNVQHSFAVSVSFIALFWISRFFFHSSSYYKLQLHNSYVCIYLDWQHLLITAWTVCFQLVFSYKYCLKSRECCLYYGYDNAEQSNDNIYILIVDTLFRWAGSKNKDNVLLERLTLWYIM